MLSKIENAVLLGAVKLSNEYSGVNETYIGEISSLSGRHRAYIKLLDEKQLVNEIIANIVGRTLELPIPEGFLVHARVDDFPETNLASFFPPDTYLLAFATKDLKHPSFARRMRSDPQIFQNLIASGRFKDWERVLVFDDWIANTDRNLGNLLVAPDFTIWLIDHGHCLTGRAWIPQHFIVGKLYRNMLADEMAGMLNAQEKRSWERNAAMFSQLLAFLPIQGLQVSAAQDLIEPDEMAAIMNFLSARINHLEEIVAKRIA